MKKVRAKNSKMNLCDFCAYRGQFPDCMDDNIEFGDGVGNDNIIACPNMNLMRQLATKEIYVDYGKESGDSDA